VVLLYDEAHLLGDDRRNAQFPLSSLLAGLGHTQRTSSRVRLVLCGLPTLSLNLKRARTYAERMFHHVVIGHLERGDAWDALGIPLRGTDRTLELSLVGEIVERTVGYPYFLQFFGGFLCSRVGPNPETNIGHSSTSSPSPECLIGPRMFETPPTLHSEAPKGSSSDVEVHLEPAGRKADPVTEPNAALGKPGATSRRPRQSRRPCDYA
jgi:hypothetical protein